MLVHSNCNLVPERSSKLEQWVGCPHLELFRARRELRVGRDEQRQPGTSLCDSLEPNRGRPLLVLGMSEGEEVAEVFVASRALDEEKDALRADDAFLPAALPMTQANECKPASGEKERTGHCPRRQSLVAGHVYPGWIWRG